MKFDEIRWNKSALTVSYTLHGETPLHNPIIHNIGAIMENVTKRDVATRMDKESKKVTTHVTFNWSDVSPDEIRAMAEQALTVKLQSTWRRNGIPTGDVTIMVREHKPGTRNVTAKDPVAAIKQLWEKLTPEQRAEQLRNMK